MTVAEAQEMINLATRFVDHMSEIWRSRYPAAALWSEAGEDFRPVAGG